MKIRQAIPIFRMFDEAKAREFYVDYLGFSVTFEHRFSPDAPLYLGLALDGFELHLSEHYGDATPVSAVRLEVDDIAAFHASLEARNYKYLRPGLERQDWGFDEVNMKDPFGNRLVFCQPHETINHKREARD
jgi:catechol 2,3-dioxygenase-like lactoylglutathione lyase family enzyme